jgi:hypothetical protein
MAGTVTIGSLQSHGVGQMLVYCLGKREGDWHCSHQGVCRLMVSTLMKFCKTSNAAAVARSADGDELTSVPITVTSKRRGTLPIGTIVLRSVIQLN